MARITAGFASSFSPQLHVPVDVWPSMGERDKSARALLAPDGKNHSYDELLAMAGPEVAQGVQPEEQAKRHKQTQDDIAALAKRIQAAKLDALLVFTDDEHRLFDEEHFPSAFFFHGETVPYVPNVPAENAPRQAREAFWAYGQEAVQLPGAPKLAEHVLAQLAPAGYELSRSHGLKEGRGIGHHIGFVNTRLLENRRMPLIPVLFNTSYPPNVMTARRMFGLGQAIGAAVASYPEDLRVGVLAVGGFTHPVIDEALDRRMLRACQDKDAESLCTLPEGNLQGPNGQGRVWIVAAGALQGLSVRFADYVACYRSPAGTGCGMGFAAWE